MVQEKQNIAKKGHGNNFQPVNKLKIIGKLILRDSNGKKIQTTNNRNGMNKIKKWKYI